MSLHLDPHEKDLEIDLIVEELEPRSTWGDLGAMTFLALLAAGILILTVFPVIDWMWAQ